MVKKVRKWPLPDRSGNHQWKHSKVDRSVPHGEEVLGNTPTEQLEHALEAFCVTGARDSASFRPDYHQFSKWLSTKLVNPDPPTLLFAMEPSRLRPQFGEYFYAFAETYKKYSALIEQAKKDTDELGGERRLRWINRYKLLRAALESEFSPRGKEFLEAYIIESDQNLEINSPLDQCTQAQLRLRLERAIEQGLEKLAFKIIGKLRGERHDPGEVDYLEAQAYFRANDFAEAAKIAAQVPSGEIDYFSAQGIVLEANAFLGNEDRVVMKLKEHGPARVSQCYLVYLLQVLINNSKNPINALQATDALHNDGNWIRHLSTKDMLWPTFNRNSCQLAAKYAEQLIQQAESDEAAEVSLVNGESTNALMEESLGTDKEGFLESMDPQESRLLLASMLDRPLFDAIVRAPLDRKFEPIVQRLLNVNYPLTFDDYKVALLAQLRLGGAR